MIHAKIGESGGSIGLHMKKEMTQTSSLHTIMDFFSKKFNPDKVKALLKLAISRMNLVSKKKRMQIEKQKKEVAEMIRSDKIEFARIRVENVIKDEQLLEAYEILNLYCELLVTRMPQLASSKELTMDLSEPVTTLIFAGPRTQIDEFRKLMPEWSSKYGREFVLSQAAAAENPAANQKVVVKLSTAPPARSLVTQYLNTIAKNNKIDFYESESEDELDLIGLGGMSKEEIKNVVTEAPGQIPDPSLPIQSMIPDSEPVKEAPPPSYEKADVDLIDWSNEPPKVTEPSSQPDLLDFGSHPIQPYVPSTQDKPETDPFSMPDQDFDDLNARFDNFKKQ